MFSAGIAFFLFNAHVFLTSGTSMHEKEIFEETLRSREENP
jgi:hypothetical protein